MTSNRSRWSWRMVAVVLLGVLAASGCGIPVDSAPQAIDPDDLADELRPAEEVATATSIPIQFEVSTYLIYFIREDGKLSPVERELSPNADVQTVLQELLRGPSVEEEDAGLTSALSEQLVVLAAETVGATVILNVEKGVLGALPTSELPVAIAQMVFTVEKLPAVSSFRLQIDGQDQPLPTDGEDAAPEEPVNRNDFKSLDPDVEEA